LAVLSASSVAESPNGAWSLETISSVFEDIIAFIPKFRATQSVLRKRKRGRRNKPGQQACAEDCSLSVHFVTSDKGHVAMVTTVAFGGE